MARFAAAYRGLHRQLRAYHAKAGEAKPMEKGPLALLPGICLDEYGYWYGTP